jgi:hypothetical protein
MVRHVNYRSFRERLRGLRRLDQDTAQEIERRIVCDPKQPSVEIAIDTAPVMRAQ